jgi:hypothetical protein
MTLNSAFADVQRPGDHLGRKTFAQQSSDLPFSIGQNTASVSIARFVW